MKPKRLGRGLSGLISRTDQPEGDAAPAAPAPRGGVVEPIRPSPNEVHTLEVVAIRPNPFQPRITFRDEDLEDLKSSIHQHGILQPLVVRHTAAGYELVAGERRLRAARLAGLISVPVVVRKASDEDMQSVALVENVQRVDLNAMEKAQALRAMMRNFGLTQEQVAERVGKARTTIANLVRLLDLPGPVQEMVRDGRLNGAQARAILQVQGEGARIALAEKAHDLGLSVRDIERLARSGPTVGKRRKPSEPAAKDPYIQDLEDRLTRALSTAVRLHTAAGGSGKIEIRYADASEFDRLLEILEAPSGGS